MAMAKMDQDQLDNLLDEVQDHLEEADSYLENLRPGWRENEAIRLGVLEDDVSGKTGNNVFDPKLPTIVLERTSRVMAANPKGKAYAQSKNDVGKNMLMNLMLDYYYKNANEQDRMFIKLRMMSEYSQVYGTMFALVPWRINERNGYVGPELNVLPIWDCFPQPTKRNVNDMDWFTVRNVVSISWLEAQDREIWMNIDELLESIEEGDGGDKIDEDKRSTVERNFFPNSASDSVYPNIELYTEYRRDKWITWTPQRIDSKTSKPFILRVVGDEENPPYPNGELPIIAKHAFPLIDSPIGIGEYHRGKSLQILLNQLWNLYITSAMYEVAPPLHISNQGGVVPSSIKWGYGEKWFMNNPNVDVQPMRFSTTGLSNFNNTFGAITSSLEAQAGTTSVRESASSQSSLGKTPEAIKFISQKESARDEWERVMLEATIEDMYRKWIALTVENMDKKVTLRLFGDEIEDIKKVYPDISEMLEDGRLNIKKEMIDDTYDFELITGSTTKKDIESEQNNMTVILKALLENPTIVESLKAEGKEVNVAELFRRWLVAGGTKEHDKIIIDAAQPELEAVQNLSPQEAAVAAQYSQAPQEVPQQQAAPQAPAGIDPSQFADPDIQAAIMQTMRDKLGGIPTQ